MDGDITRGRRNSVFKTPLILNKPTATAHFIRVSLYHKSLDRACGLLLCFKKTEWVSEGFFWVIIFRRDDHGHPFFILFAPSHRPELTIIFHIISICSLRTPPKVLIIVITGVSVNMVYDAMEGVGVGDENHPD